MDSEEEKFIFRWEDEYEDDPIQARCVIIGNGFDLECGLPTSYGDLLDFISSLEGIYGDLEEDSNKRGVSTAAYGGAFFESYMRAHPHWIMKKLDGIHKEIADMLIRQMGGDEHFFDYWQPLFENYWYKHFVDRRAKKATTGKGWVDFEFEISRVIRLVEDSMVDDRRYQADIDDRVGSPNPGDLPAVIKIAYDDKYPKPRGSSRNPDYVWFDLTYRELRKKLLDDLDGLTRGLEAYLRDYVERIKVKPTPVINKIICDLRAVMDHSETCVISFNYTDTLERLLRDQGVDVKFCYAHGRLGDGKSKNQMVLGMDEYLDGDKVRSMTDFARFRKYNQRIFKRTDSSYMSWIRTFSEYKSTRREVIVFGHSLGVSDHDLLRQLMSLYSTRVVVYYYDDDAFSDLLANMTAMMGKEYVIERTGSELHTLKFEDQNTIS